MIEKIKNLPKRERALSVISASRAMRKNDAVRLCPNAPLVAPAQVPAPERISTRDCRLAEPVLPGQPSGPDFRPCRRLTAKRAAPFRVRAPHLARYFPPRLAFPLRLGYPLSMHTRRILARIFFATIAERHWRSHL